MIVCPEGAAGAMTPPDVRNNTLVLTGVSVPPERPWACTVAVPPRRAATARLIHFRFDISHSSMSAPHPYPSPLVAERGRGEGGNLLLTTKGSGCRARPAS